MIREEQIPKEAEEAGQNAVIAALHLIEPDARAGELTMDECAEIARAAIAAALSAWPGVQIVEERADMWAVYLEILPLPQAPRDG
jgi:hypothetical protein